MSGKVITSRFISRFTDSPEPGSKGRAKRNRNSLTPADLEPRKNLRSSKAKGKGKKGPNNGSSGSDEPRSASSAEAEGEEPEEGRVPNAMTVPEGPSHQEREEHAPHKTIEVDGSSPGHVSARKMN